MFVGHSIPKGCRTAEYEYIEIGRIRWPRSLALGPANSLIAPLTDQLALEFGEAAHQCEDQFALRRGRIAPGVIERSEARVGGLDVVEQLEQIADGAREPVQPDHISVSPGPRALIALSSSWRPFVDLPDTFSAKIPWAPAARGVLDSPGGNLGDHDGGARTFFASAASRHGSNLVAT